MLSRVVLSAAATAAPCLKNAAALGPGGREKGIRSAAGVRGCCGQPSIGSGNQIWSCEEQ
uniref:ATP synthase peripheral stalk-membrane subunit b n=1 Tax=Mus musculus TaxID=10090 RepID=D6RGL7_MOUSE